MKKSLNSLKGIETLSQEQMGNVKGGGIWGTQYNNHCEWYAGLYGIPLEEVPTHSPLGQFVYQLDLALGLM